MTETPQNASESNVQSPQNGVEVEELIQSLRRKEGTWVEWGRSCQALQKAGFSPQVIFEETGFEPIHQNQVIVGAQVYATMLNAGVSDAVQQHFEHRGSDVLYELRILTQAERASVAELALEKKIDVDEAREVAKAVKELSRLSALPEGFTNHPGDAVAYQSWKLARQKADFQERSRLIARGLKFAHSETARQKVEQLLTDFTVTATRPMPRLPLYRLESSDEMPRILPVVGKLPLSKVDLQAVPLSDEVGPFKLVRFSGTGAWVPIPGWQVIRNAEDPVVFLCDSDRLPNPLPGKPEEVLVVVDRAQRQWDADSYFVIEQEDFLQLQYFEEWNEEVPLLGRIILVMRPKKVLDENYMQDPWQIDE
jgi:hypothetical protein